MSSGCEECTAPAVPTGGDKVQQSIGTPDIDRRTITAALMLVMVLASMEQTVTSTAMPTIIGALHGLEHYSWVASIYLLACTVSMPLYGRLADALGRKRVIIAALGLFCLSSLLASTARTMPQLILYRGIQGLGAGGIMPVVLTILGDIFTLEERAKIQGLFSAVWGCAALGGPALGAVLVKAFGWQSIFFVNLPCGVLGLVVLIWKYHDHEKPHSVDLDLPGVAALAMGCMATLALVSRLGPGGWPVGISIGLAVVAAFSVIFFIVHERRTSHPILPMDILMNPAIGPSLLGSCLFGIGFLSLDTFVPLYVQGGQGGGPGAAAWVVTPVMLTWSISGVIAAPAVVKWGFRKTSLFGCVIITIGFSGLLICTHMGSSKEVLACVLALAGLGFGPVSMSYLLSAQNAVAWQQRGMVTSSVQFFRTMGGAVGIGVLGALFNVLTQPSLKSLENQGISAAILLDPEKRKLLPAPLLESAGHMIRGGLHWVFVGMLAVAIVQIVVTCFMPKRKADHHITALEAAEAMAG